MARLILDEKGKRRAFRLNNGRLTIGSSADNSLVLVSSDVADTHAEIRVEDGTVTLIPKPGVMPPTLLGRAVKQPTRLAANSEFKIGSAVFRIVADEQASVPAPGATKSSRSDGVSARRTASGDGARIQHTRRTVKRGMPTWAILAVVALVGVVGYFFFRNWLEDGLETEWDPTARYHEAVLAYQEGSVKRAKEELGRIDLTRVTPELKEKVQEFQDKVKGDEERALLAEHNMSGTKWLDSNLKGYAKSYLSGDRAERPKARYFVRRCDEFKQEWPKHPELEWVNRYRSRFAKIAEMDSPAEYADLEWEVGRRTAAKPRDYALVFRLIDQFLLESEGDQRAAGQALYQDQIAGREEYFLDRMQESRYQWEKQQYGKAVEWLVQVILKIGDEAMEDQAIDFFLKMQTVDGAPLSDRYLASYKSNRPEQFEILMEHERLREAARSAGVL
jgi:hypothetical protein